MTTKLQVFFNYPLRILILITSLTFLYFQLKNKIDIAVFSDVWTKESLNEHFNMLLFFCVSLMPLNWLFEIYKWKFICSNFSSIDFKKCVKGVVSGITISMFLPNRIGDVLGKVLWIESGKRWMAFFANTYASFAQIIATCLLAITSILFFKLYLSIDFFSIFQFTQLITYISVFVIILFIITYYNLHKVVVFVAKRSGGKLKKAIQHAHVLSGYTFNQRTVVLFISLMRFFTYSLQYYLLLKAFGFKAGLFEGVLLVSIIYFFITVIPQFAIVEIATRGAIAIGVFQLYLHSGGSEFMGYELKILICSTLMWIVNLFVPAMIGLTMMPNVKKIFSNKSKTQ
jgi:hypothetical protein